MAKGMNAIALLSTLITMLCLVFYLHTNNSLLFTLMITFGTTSYHFIMRLIVGHVINLLLHNHVDYRIRWFQVSTVEKNLYRKLGVKKWKSKMPTYDQSFFDYKLHSWDEIAQAMCQAELVHEVIILLSFVPIFASIPFGAVGVFAITSILAACFDGMFAIMQRYNRPRIIKMIKMIENKKY